MPQVNRSGNGSAPLLCKTKLEVCVDSLESARNALMGGADELEVCSSLHDGGLTPSMGLVKKIVGMVQNNSPVGESNTFSRPKVNVMIRCRPGFDFCYNKSEMDTMLEDIRQFKDTGIDRFVFGALTPDGDIDVEKCKLVVATAGMVPLTFHRAFDVCKNPVDSICKIIVLGFNRLLTSGQRTSAADVDALVLIKHLLVQYGNKLEIMPGAGVNTGNLKTFVDLGCNIVHGSFKILRPLPPANSNVGDDNFKNVMVTDASTVKIVKQIIASIKSE